MCDLGMIQSEENSECCRESLRNREVDFHLQERRTCNTRALHKKQKLPQQGEK